MVKMFGMSKQRFHCLNTGIRIKLERALVVAVTTGTIHSLQQIPHGGEEYDFNADVPLDKHLRALNNAEKAVRININAFVFYCSVFVFNQFEKDISFDIRKILWKYNLNALR